MNIEQAKILGINLNNIDYTGYGDSSLDDDPYKVFLGGTCNNSTWREKLIPMLNCKYFNPVVSDWTEDCQKMENYQKALVKVQLYVITPLMKGVFSIAEAVQSSNDNPEGTVFCYLESDILPEENGELSMLSFDKAQLKSLKATADLIANNGSHICTTIEECASIINKILE